MTNLLLSISFVHCRFICDARNKLLCVFLHRFKSHLAIQVWVIGAANAITLSCLHPVALMYVPISESSATKVGSQEFEPAC
jgi:hypothetical protein